MTEFTREEIEYANRPRLEWDAKPVLQQVNFLQMMPGGHCYYCHKDYPESHNFEECKSLNEKNYHAPCDERCKDSKFYEVQKKL